MEEETTYSYFCAYRIRSEINTNQRRTVTFKKRGIKTLYTYMHNHLPSQSKRPPFWINTATLACVPLQNHETITSEENKNHRGARPKKGHMHMLQEKRAGLVLMSCFTPQRKQNIRGRGNKNQSASLDSLERLLEKARNGRSCALRVRTQGVVKPQAQVRVVKAWRGMRDIKDKEEVVIRARVPRAASYIRVARLSYRGLCAIRLRATS